MAQGYLNNRLEGAKRCSNRTRVWAPDCVVWNTQVLNNRPKKWRSEKRAAIRTRATPKGIDGRDVFCSGENGKRENVNGKRSTRAVFEFLPLSLKLENTFCRMCYEKEAPKQQKMKNENGKSQKSGAQTPPYYMLKVACFQQYSIDPSFKASRLSLLDRGFIYAIAHIRGGGEMGRQWYENGKLSKKKNTFTDFIACAEYLIEKKYCTKEKLCIEGRSAGGLLIGAVLNMRPDLFKAAVAGVPFVDVLTTMLDPTIPLTTSEWEEWGDPRKEEFYFYMKSYSPVDNVRSQNYPAILVTAGLHDPRVMYSEPAKFVAKLRDTKTDNNLLLFKCEQGAGHFSKSGRFEKLREDAFVFAFIMKALDMVPSFSSGEK